MENFEQNLKQKKTAILYHGSPISNLRTLEPREKSYRDPDEGPRVFATPDIAVASIFMLEGVAASGKFGNIPYAIILTPRDAFIEHDQGGHIYTTSSEGFENDPDKGLGQDEWTSRETVQPIQTLTYTSSLDAALEHGVQVYFLDRGTYEAIRNSDDHGYSILKNLESENKKRGVNVRLLGE